MIAKHVTNKKQLMKALLAEETFDRFELVSGSVDTFAEFSVDGRYNAAFFGKTADDNAGAEGDPSPNGHSESSEGTPSEREFTPWQLLRPFFLSVIRGKNTPLSFKFVFRLPSDTTARLFEDEGIRIENGAVSGLLMNLTFDGTSILLTTGVSHRTFSMDREPERVWDAWVESFFGKTGIDLSE